jgi:hypothetical protein
VSRVIILDAGPLGLITNPKLSAESVVCAQWLQTHITSGRSRIIIPEIALGIPYRVPVGKGISISR